MQTGKEYGFIKKERLFGKKEIGRLFLQGQSYFSYPYNFVWSESSVPQDYPAKVCISVSRKNFRKAVERNRIKRLTREAWRKEKQELYRLLEKNNMKISVMLIYVAVEIPDQDFIRSKLRKLVIGFARHLDNLKNQGEKKNINHE